MILNFDQFLPFFLFIFEHLLNLDLFKRDLKRMEMTILSKINWEVSESTSVDFFSSLLDYIHVTTHNRKVVGLDAKKVLLHFLAKQLTNFETARIPPLELAFGLFMVAFKKYSMQVKISHVTII